MKDVMIKSLPLKQLSKIYHFMYRMRNLQNGLKSLNILLKILIIFALNIFYLFLLSIIYY